MPTQSAHSANTMPLAAHHSSSWMQLILFTGFLFLLVAIPYTLYLKATQPPSSTKIENPPPKVKLIPTPTPTIVITPPPASASSACFPVPEDFVNTTATPAAYLFKVKQKMLCYPPALPPFPFTWRIITSYQYNYTIEIPGNWIDKSTVIKNTALNIFTSEEHSTTSAAPTVSFAWYDGQNPYASDSSYLKTSVVRDGKPGKVYTKSNVFIAAVFQMSNGYLLLEASAVDSAFYAFEHMLDTLHFTK